MWQKGPSPPISPKSQMESPPPSSRLESLRRRLNKLYSRGQIAIFICVGIIIAFLAMYLYNMTQPPPQRLTQNDINNAVARALASPSPTPSFESQVYSAVHPSVVGIEAQVPESGGKIESSV